MSMNLHLRAYDGKRRMVSEFHLIQTPTYISDKAEKEGFNAVYLDYVKTCLTGYEKGSFKLFDDESIPWTNEDNKTLDDYYALYSRGDLPISELKKELTVLRSYRELNKRKYVYPVKNKRYFLHVLDMDTWLKKWGDDYDVEWSVE